MEDYKSLGLKCGLEVHQQLDTGKLFSRTPSILRDDAPHYKILRYLRPVASETGEQDRAALEAFAKGLYYNYEGYNDTVSLVELDCEPPQPIDNEALRTILEVGSMLGSDFFDEMIVMRKAVIDGSNTSGFQRTMLAATGGQIKLRGKTLGVQTIVLEEDSARPTEKTDKYISYNLDRLGIALIELATEPGIETPEQAKEAALAIGTIFRLTGKAKRGLGTIRQDLNVSIRGGARVEIKGVQELEIIDEYVRREVQRQSGLIDIKKALTQRGAKKEEIMFLSIDLSEIFSSTESKLVKSALANGERVMGLKLAKFASLIGFEIQPNRRLGTEFANCVKTRTGLKGTLHSDELPNYGISVQEVEKVRKELGCEEEDAFVMVTGSAEKAQNALHAIFERAEQTFDGVPEETRGALEGGNTEYLRPLPGAARMYPETDIATIMVAQKTMKEIAANLPLSVLEREKLYAKFGLNAKHVDEMKLSNYARLFEKLVGEKIDAKKAAVFLLEGIVEARRAGAKTDNLTKPHIEAFIRALNDGRITKEIQLEVLKQQCEKPNATIDQLLAMRGHKAADSSEVEKIVGEIVAYNAEIVAQKGMGAISALMGDAMKELRGKASGKEISEALSKEITRNLKK